MPRCDPPRLVADSLICGDWVVISAEKTLRDGAVAIAGDCILETGLASELISRYPNAARYGGSGKIVIPGLINTHTHLFQTFLKGVGQGLELREWVKNVTTRAALSMSERDAYLSAAVGLIEAVHSGTTFVCEFSYAYPEPELNAAILQAFVDFGLRGWLGMGLNDNGEQDGINPALIRPVEQSLKRADALQRLIRQQAPSHVSLALTPSNLRGLSREGAAAISNYAREKGINWSIHLNESPNDNHIAQARSGKNAVQLLEEYGVLSPDLLAVHCVKMSSEDIALLAERDVGVSHNPVSNMYLGSGTAPVVVMRNEGLRVGLGSDGAASNNSQDMLETLKMTALCQRAHLASPKALSAPDALGMATLQGAEAIHRGQELGALLPGYKADITLMRSNTAKMLPLHDPVAAIVFSCGEENVESVFIGGRLVMENGRLMTVDEQALLAEAQQAASALLVRAQISP